MRFRSSEDTYLNYKFYLNSPHLALLPIPRLLRCFLLGIQEKNYYSSTIYRIVSGLEYQILKLYYCLGNI